MQVERIEVDRTKARELHALYHQHRKDETAMDAEIRQAYKLIGQGRMIIQALASIIAAGAKEDGTPKLAICNAAEPRCRLLQRREGETIMYRDNGRRINWTDKTNVFRFPVGTFPFTPAQHDRWTREHTAIVPMIPPHLRPRKALTHHPGRSHAAAAPPGRYVDRRGRVGPDRRRARGHGAPAERMTVQSAYETACGEIGG